MPTRGLIRSKLGLSSSQIPNDGKVAYAFGAGNLCHTVSYPRSQALFMVIEGLTHAAGGGAVEAARTFLALNGRECQTIRLFAWSLRH